MSEKLERRLQELREQAKAFAEAEGDRIYLENFKASKLAILMKDVEARMGLTTVAAQEREARAHPDYIQLLEALREATKIAEKNKWLLRISMRGSSLYQTEQAALRAEMQAYGIKEA
jgi:hypothetical protein